MELPAADELLDDGLSFAASSASRERLQAGIGSMERLIAVCQARVVELAEYLSHTSSVPEADVAAAGRMSLRQGAKIVKRAKTLSAAPSLTASFASGNVSAGHVDAFGSTLARVSETVAAKLIADESRLTTIAERTTPDRFAKTLADEVRRLEAPDDEAERVSQQKAAVRLVSFLDDAGMGRWLVWLDPETYAQLEPLLDAQVNALFFNRVPEHCPKDPLAETAVPSGQGADLAADQRRGALDPSRDDRCPRRTCHPDPVRVRGARR